MVQPDATQPANIDTEKGEETPTVYEVILGVTHVARYALVGAALMGIAIISTIISVVNEPGVLGRLTAALAIISGALSLFAFFCAFAGCSAIAHEVRQLAQKSEQALEQTPEQN